MDFAHKTVLEIVELISNKKLSCIELVDYYLANIEKYKDKNAVLEVFDDARTRAMELDEKLKTSVELPPLFGVPILIKDNIMYKGKICSNASKMMEDYIAQYNATVIDRLLDAGVIILGRTNMDEFAMGGSCENSAFGPTRNAHDDSRVSGGSSGGSAVSVALDMCAFALGSDTGGSVRQPASYNGVVGLKPTYARISRYGLCAYASSLDTVGIFTKTVKDNAYILSILAGRDKNDDTSSTMPIDNYLGYISSGIAGKRIALIEEVEELVSKTNYAHVYHKVADYCQKHGAIVTRCHIPDYKYVIPTYYTIAMAEASSNMGRLDGIKYGKQQNGKSLAEVYSKSRAMYLGKEVKRRILLGNFVLSSKYYNAYYLKAKKIVAKIRKQFMEIFKDNDVIFMPTTYGEAFEIGSKVSDPVSMYIEDMFTVTANMVGIPAISVPVGKGAHGLPIGLQILGAHFNEKEIYNIANFVTAKEEVACE
jgi:aspartyl-tRNA(Asn)/glutamyl-tRNA(Gln) amidotransferase subunit A